LPRHRGIAAIEWTIREGDPIAGGSVYHLADRMDAGAIAAQEWVFVRKGETARELWERALAPLGQKLLGDMIDYAKIHKSLRLNLKTSNSPLWRRALPAPSTDHRPDVIQPVSERFQARKVDFPFQPRNRIHLDVFEILGTFRVIASHQTLDTLCPDKALHHTHLPGI